MTNLSKPDFSELVEIISIFVRFMLFVLITSYRVTGDHLIISFIQFPAILAILSPVTSIGTVIVSMVQCYG